MPTVSVHNRNTRGKWRPIITTGWAVPANSYPVGALTKIAQLDKQPGLDLMGVIPTTASANQTGLAGIVAYPFVSQNSKGVNYSGGVDNKGGTTYPAAGALGTYAVPLTVRGIHEGVLLDLSAGNTVTHGTTLVSSANTAGYMQGATSVAQGICAEAIMASAAPFNSISNASLAAATQTITVTGTPATNETYTIPFQVPFNENAYGVAQYVNLVVGPLTSTQSATTTTAAAAIVAALTANVGLSEWYSATNVANVVTITVVSNPFRVTWQGLAQLNFTWGASVVVYSAGAVGNWLTLGAMTVSSTTTLTAGGGTASFSNPSYPTTSTLFSGGTGYKGPWPAIVKI